MRSPGEAPRPPPQRRTMRASTSVLSLNTSFIGTSAANSALTMSLSSSFTTSSVTSGAADSFFSDSDSRLPRSPSTIVAGRGGSSGGGYLCLRGPAGGEAGGADAISPRRPPSIPPPGLFGPRTLFRPRKRPRHSLTPLFAGARGGVAQRLFNRYFASGPGVWSQHDAEPVDLRGAVLRCGRKTCAAPTTCAAALAQVEVFHLAMSSSSLVADGRAWSVAGAIPALF